MSIVDKFKSAARRKNLSVALPDGNDARTLRAAAILTAEGIAKPIVLGKADEIAALAATAGVDLDGIMIVDPAKSDRIEEYAVKYREKRDNVSVAIARRIVRKPLYYGGCMVAVGDADAMVAGADSSTATVIQAGALTVGLAPGIATPSSFFLMILPNFHGEKDKGFIFADCAVNVDPTPEELAEIALASATSCEKLLSQEPRVAMISFSTCGSASHKRVTRVKEALQIAAEREPHLAIDGEFQVDSAIVPAVAAKKVKGHSRVAGKANVLVFPDLDTGNAAYKLTQHMGGAMAIGPFFQGFAKPISDLSRGASVEDIVSTVAITLAQV